MAGTFQTWFGLRRRRQRESFAPAAAPRPPEAVERQTGRALARDLDDALARKQWNLAEQLANAAMRLPPDVRRSAGLCERIARLRAVQGDAETAIAIIDSAGVQSSSLRLLRAACLLQLGRCDEAHLELRQWACRSSAPVSARSMLALLEWHGGDILSACDVLRLNVRQIEDPATLAMLMLIHEAGGNRDQADRWAERLRRACAFSPEWPLYNRMLQSIGRDPTEHATVVPDEAQVETLALELIAGEQAIPALVDAQQLRPQPPTALLLIAAIEIALPELEDQAAAHLGLIELKCVMGDVRGALESAERAVNECPMSVLLTRRVSELRGQVEQAAAEHDVDQSTLTRTERAA